MRRAIASCEEASVLFALLDVAEDCFHRAFVDDRAHIGVLGRIAHLDLLHTSFQHLQELVVDPFIDDRSGTCRTLLTLESEGRLGYAFDCGIDVSVGIDDDRVFAAHGGNLTDDNTRPWMAYVDGDVLRKQSGDARRFSSPKAAYAAACKAAPRRWHL